MAAKRPPRIRVTTRKRRVQAKTQEIYSFLRLVRLFVAKILSLLPRISFITSNPDKPEPKTVSRGGAEIVEKNVSDMGSDLKLCVLRVSA